MRCRLNCILSADATHPGSAYDPLIWATSDEKIFLAEISDSGEQSWLLGQWNLFLHCVEFLFKICFNSFSNNFLLSIECKKFYIKSHLKIILGNFTYMDRRAGISL